MAFLTDDPSSGDIDVISRSLTATEDRKVIWAGIKRWEFMKDHFLFFVVNMQVLAYTASMRPHRCWAQDTVHRVCSTRGRCCRSSNTSSWSCWSSALRHTSCCQSKSSCSSSSSSCLRAQEIKSDTKLPQHDVKTAGESRRTHAVVASIDLHVVHRADAGVVSNGVVALAWATDAWSFTLIDICPQRGKRGIIRLLLSPQNDLLLSQTQHLSL